VLGFGANFLLWMIDMLRDQISVKWIAEGLAFLSLYNRNEAFLMGQMSPAGMIYEISFTILFLAMTVYHLETGGTHWEAVDRTDDGRGAEFEPESWYS